MEREISAGEATLPGLWASFHPSLPTTTGPFKHSGLGSEDTDPWWDLGGDPQQSRMEKIQCKPELSHLYREATNDWMDPLSSVLPSLFPNLFTRRGFTRHGSPEGWVWIMAHHRRGLCSLMFIACGLKCRKSLWECQWSRKEKTSLVLRPSYIFSIWNSCVLSQFSLQL